MPLPPSHSPFAAFTTGVIKSVVGELTDPTNRAQAFGLIPLPWAIGASIGYAVSPYSPPSYSQWRVLSSPLIGGTFSKPSERFPSLFGGAFWRNYPYFLPCLITSSFVLFAFTIALVFFKEVPPLCLRLGFNI